MTTITPHLWFDTQAKEAAALYTAIFPDSRITHSSTLRHTPSGDTDIVSFELAGQPFMAISAGPLFRFNPSISFLVACQTKDEVDRLWAKLSEDGQVLMPLDVYPFSERFGWLQDRYGLSWQVMFMGDWPFTQKITPTLLFTGAVCGKAEEAIGFYTSLFSGSPVGQVHRYGEGEAPDRPGTIKHAEFTLHGRTFAAMDSAHDHKFAFNEAISFLVPCETQDEIDFYWSRLSAVPQAEQCGWLKDKYGVSWQITPTAMMEMMNNGTPEQIARVTQAFLKMKKFDLAALKQAYAG
jgi:predicted 3-demethylubiquinone-9 3-methyltransferase (glyoxalase superfamily)